LLRSLQSRIILFISIIVLIGGLSMSYMIYTSSQQLVLDGLGKQALSIAEAAAQKIDIAQYEQLAQEQQMNDAYRSMQQKLHELKASNGLKYLYTMSRDQNGNYYYVIDGSTLDMESEDFSGLGEVEPEVDELTALTFDKKHQQLGSLEYTEEYGATISAYHPILKDNGDIIGIIGADFDGTEIYEVMSKNRNMTIIIVAVSVILSLLLINIITKLMLRPMRQLLYNMRRVHEGDLTVQLTAKTRDEIGMLTEGFSELTAELRSSLGKLSASHTVIQSSIETLSDNVSKAEQLGETLSKNVAFADKQSTVQHQASNETTVAMAEVAQAMRHVAAASEAMFNVASRATDLSDSGNDYMNQLQQQMEIIQQTTSKATQDIVSLQNLSHDVQEMVVMIKRISAQTGMLALNASIEASRAGEQGKGFNVVAQEVRKLADQSDIAANQVEEIIGKMLHLTEQASSASRLSSEEVVTGAQVVTSVGEVFGSISNEITQVEQQADHLSSTSSQISATLEGLNELTEQAAQMSEEAVEATNEMQQTMQVTYQSVRQMKDMVSQLNVQAAELEQLLRRFKL